MHFRPIVTVPLLALLAAVSSSAWAGPPEGAPVHGRVLEELARGGQADVLVVFRERPDLRAARDLPTREAKGRFVYEALTRAARRSQRGLKATLEAQRVPYRAHYLGNLIRVRVDADLLEEIARRPEVARIDADPAVALRTVEEESSGPESTSAVEWGVSRVGASILWGQGIRGAGAVVAIADTGVEWDHPALRDQYRGWDGSSGVHDYNWHDATDVPSGLPVDPNSHGTHVTGTAVGDDGADNQIGVAPDARWIACRNMDASGNGTPGRYTECFEFFLAPYPVGGDPLVDGIPDLAPDVINNSWYCPPEEGCGTDTLRSIVEDLRAAGIVVVTATGNRGPVCSSVEHPPEIYEAALSVGATQSDDGIAAFSSRGPVTADGSGRRKPDLAAPGSGIRSSVPGGGYGSRSGTSMASPHVAGAAALLLSANPSLKGLPDRLESLMLAGARPKTAPVACGGEAVGAIPNNTFGAGILFAPDSLAVDPDLDGYPFGEDNCPETNNPDQADGDSDGTGDACDCAPANGAVSGLPGEAGPVLDWSPEGGTLLWGAAPEATGHHVYEATLVSGVAPGFSCLHSDLPGTSAPIATVPALGQGTSYLVVGTNCFGLGTPGEGSGGSPRTVPPACP
jgi:subtilisin family serine protease